MIIKLTANDYVPEVGNTIKKGNRLYRVINYIWAWNAINIRYLRNVKVRKRKRK